MTVEKVDSSTQSRFIDYSSCRAWRAGRRARRSSLLPVRAQFPGLHAEETRKVPLHLDSGRQAWPPYGHLGDLAVRVEQDLVHPVDHGVFDLQPEVRGVVRLAAEDLLVGEVGRHRADGPYGFQDCLAASDWLVTERAVQHHVLGEDAGKSVF